jgi:hypothetical protein
LFRIDGGIPQESGLDLREPGFQFVQTDISVVHEVDHVSQILGVAPLDLRQSFSEKS